MRIDDLKIDRAPVDEASPFTPIVISDKQNKTHLLERKRKTHYIRFEVFILIQRYKRDITKYCGKMYDILIHMDNEQLLSFTFSDYTMSISLFRCNVI